MEYIRVGYVANTHGIKGDLKIYPLTEEPDRFEQDIDFYIGDENLKVKIDKTRFYRGMVYIKLENYDNINDVLKFKGKYISIDKKNRIELPKDTYYISDLIGMEIVNKGEIIGVVKDVLLNSTNDIYICETSSKKEFMIPVVKEFVKIVDLEQRKIFVELIEGML